MSYDSGESNGTLRCSILPNAMDRVMELVTEPWVKEQAFQRHPSEVVQSATEKELQWERRKYDLACKKLNGYLRDQREDLRR